jgi:tetratricopeptide (TPR) repeat protein
MKRNSRIIVSLVITFASGVTIAFADSNEKGIDLYRAELYNAAKIFFTQQTNQFPTEQAENYYYLGQTYYELQQIDSASYFYDKAVATDPDYPFGYIGQGKIILSKGDKKEAENLFKKANGLAKKDPSIQTSIAEVYIDLKLYPLAEEALDKARKIKKTYPGIYVAEGDMLAQEGKIGDACARYENAITFDKTYKVAYLKIARVYKNININEASRYLNELIAIDSDYIPAYAEIGDLYDMSSIDETNVNYTKALEAYEKFISIPGVPLLQHERYARLLYFTNQYEKSLKQINLLLQQTPDNQVMSRLKAYNNYKLKNYALAVEQLTAFLQKNPEKDIIYLDYLTLAQALLKEKQTDQAIVYFIKASEAKDAKPNVYKELASAYETANNYPEAIKVYEKFFEIEPASSVFDYFYYGQDIYSAAAKYIDPEYLKAQRTPEEQAMDDADLNLYIEKGNKAFSEVINRSPDSYLGYLWKARLNSFLDAVEQSRTEKTNGVAKPFYEDALKVMLAKNEDGARNKDIIEAYLYLGSYSYVSNDKVKAIEYYTKILEINPDHEGAKVTLEALKKK